MRILAKGNSKRSEELKQKLSLLDFEVNFIDENTTFILNDDNFDAIFDLNFDDNDQSNPPRICAVKFRKKPAACQQYSPAAGATQCYSV